MRAVARVLTAALVIIGLVVSWFSAAPLGMASDACVGGGGLICTVTGQMLAFWLPFVGLAAGVAGVKSRKRAPLTWGCVGWLIFFVALIAAFTIAAFPL